MPATKNPLRADPSRTSGLQKRYVADLNRRFAALGRAVRQLVDVDDAFGLRSTLTRNTRWAFDTNDGKMRSFRGWLRYQTAQGILGTDADDPTRPWTADYVDSAFLRGVDRAAIDATRGTRQEQDAERDRMRTRMTTGAQSLERLRMLYLRSFEDLQGVTTHMSLQMSKILASGLLHGLNPREIARQLTQQVGLSRGRAETIARTECLPAETLVDAAVVGAAFRRWYVGPMVEIKTSNSRKITATPNHPMLTQNGWVAAGLLQQGDYLICNAGQHDSGASGDENVKRGVATISEIFDSVRAVGVGKRMRSRKPDFHGDGLDGDVDAFTADRPLSLGRFSPLYEPLAENVFTPAGFAASCFCSFCRRLMPVNEGVCLCTGSQLDTSFFESAADKTVGGSSAFGDLFEGESLGVKRRRPLGVDVCSEVIMDPSPIPRVALGLGVGSHDSFAPDHLGDPSGASSHLLGDLFQSQPAEIQLDRVETLTLRSFSGHVFNLSTPYGYFNIAGGVYTGNTIAVHAQAQLDTFAAMGIEGVTARAELLTAGDSRVCIRCASLEGRVFSLQQAQGIIPLHPRCRCCWQPHLEDD